ncbi:TPA: XkdX family protein [Listeria monocytogenes]|nr:MULTISPECIES: XkdX family protein [Listeria]EAC2922156.1 XkdX family protein [Listeria monocytogenes]EAC5867843.1 XkdX family protein [Listeria monocytogenes]EAC8118512.1 XkdX family protein [Listeria monocytogenes]EAC9742627.1 XkdX family protein [Listeria monocytogenes]EAD2103964.1 XkdX family protein [Listeria monocytogenes]
MINWYEKVKDYFNDGYYTEEQVYKFVALKKLTLEQAKEIVETKEA